MIPPEWFDDERGEPGGVTSYVVMPDGMTHTSLAAIDPAPRYRRYKLVWIGSGYVAVGIPESEADDEEKDG